jgi:MFS family permease
MSSSGTDRGRVDLMINGSYWVVRALGALGTLILLDPQRLPVWLGWRCAFGIGAILGLVVIFFRQWIPESPRWLMIHGRNHEAEQIVADVERLVEDTSPVSEAKCFRRGSDANAHTMARDLECDRSRTSAAFSPRLCSHAYSGILLQRDLFHLRAGVDEILQRAGAECWRLPAAVRAWQRASGRSCSGTSSTPLGARR